MGSPVFSSSSELSPARVGVLLFSSTNAFVVAGRTLLRRLDFSQVNLAMRLVVPLASAWCATSMSRPATLPRSSQRLALAAVSRTTRTCKGWRAFGMGFLSPVTVCAALDCACLALVIGCRAWSANYQPAYISTTSSDPLNNHCVGW